MDCPCGALLLSHRCSTPAQELPSWLRPTVTQGANPWHLPCHRHSDTVKVLQDQDPCGNPLMTSVLATTRSIPRLAISVASYHPVASTSRTPERTPMNTYCHHCQETTTMTVDLVPVIGGQGIDTLKCSTCGTVRQRTHRGSIRTRKHGPVTGPREGSAGRKRRTT